MEIGERIRKLRIEKDLTQEDLGNSVGISRAAVNKIEKGVTENIKRSQIEKFAEVLEVSPSFLMGWEHVQKIGRINRTTDIQKMVNEAITDLFSELKIIELDNVLDNIINANNITYKNKKLDEANEKFIKTYLQVLINYLERNE